MDYCCSDTKMRIAFERFYEVAKISTWKTPQEIIGTFNHADLVVCLKTGRPRIVFNIGHNKYRLVTGYYFGSQTTVLYVKFVGTHVQYDKIDVCTVDMFKSK